MLCTYHIIISPYKAKFKSLKVFIFAFENEWGLSFNLPLILFIVKIDQINIFI